MESDPARHDSKLALAGAVESQRAWQRTSIRERCRVARNVSRLIAERAESLIEAIALPERMGRRETISSEVLPLADAAKWLGQNSARHLSPKSLGWSGRPGWLGRLATTIYREPWGLVLIIGTWNYPLFLTGVPSLQAIVAGNAVCIKPAPGSEAICQLWCKLLVDAGVPAELVVLLPSDPSAASHAIHLGVQHVVLTGSSNTGRKVLNHLAAGLTSATLELSGCDAVIVLESADLVRVADALMFGLRLNSGATCMAPRRVLIEKKVYVALRELLAERLASEPTYPVRESTARRLVEHAQEACSLGAKSIIDVDWEQLQQAEGKGYWHLPPIVLYDVPPVASLAKHDTFAPTLLLMPIERREDIVAVDAQCPYALSASIFGNSEEAESLAQSIDAGFVTINDLIVPTADPRVPFGGRRESGFGVTRGVEGLLEMTQIKVVSRRLGKWLPHLQPTDATDESLLLGFLRLRHSKKFFERMGAIKSIVQAIRGRTK